MFFHRIRPSAHFRKRQRERGISDAEVRATVSRGVVIKEGRTLLDDADRFPLAQVATEGEYLLERRTGDDRYVYVAVAIDGGEIVLVTTYTHPEVTRPRPRRVRPPKPAAWRASGR